jgi:3-hydroxybutyryl-CoA dehydrogenase
MNVLVLGSGQMGIGIAIVISLHGKNVTLYDNNSDSLALAFEKIQAYFDKQVAKGQISQIDADTYIKYIRSSNDLESVCKNVQVCIEAVTEKYEVKKTLFEKISNLVAPTTIMCSNTSSISITKLARSFSNPQNFIGLHFMNPVPVMKLVEVIPGLQTSKETVGFTEKFCQEIGKTIVKAPDYSGFIVNRILAPMLNEAFFLVQEGCTPCDVDTAMKLGTNQPMGPLELSDFVGLDTLLSILEILHTELGEDKYRPCPLLRNYVAAGWLGKKTKQGVYTYEQ